MQNPMPLNETTGYAMISEQFVAAISAITPLSTPAR